MQPDYIFETSWEVCNKVGGIYAVLSTRAASMQAEHPDQVIFFGPDFGDHSNIYFRQDDTLLAEWQTIFHAAHPDIPVRVGRWQVPGQPIAILLRNDAMWQRKDEIYAWAWQHFHVQSHAAYGDYDESCLFGYAAGVVMQSLHDFVVTTQPKARFCMHANEWQTAFAIFYLRHYCPSIATLFTTHATGIGRSIAGNGKPLYDYFERYNGDQMAMELNMVSKHSVEKQAAYWADCFTTVSDITARECKQLLDKPVDIVTPNGFEPGFVPAPRKFDVARRNARRALAKVATQALGTTITDHAQFVCIAGRQEWKNKGIDVFLQSMERLGEKMYHQQVKQQVVAFVMIPYLDHPVMRCGQVSIVFVPYYLDGHDPLFGMTYYDLLIGMDASVFPSYYEPWGYTPLESVAFSVPTITTSLAGFGAWADTGIEGLHRGVVVIPRTDSNYSYVVEQIADSLIRWMQYSPSEVAEARKAAAAIAHQAEWRFFYKHYHQAYDIAIRNQRNRTKKDKR